MIDLNRYNLSYDIQFIELMIELLEPYIDFKRLHNGIYIYRINDGVKKKITNKEYIIFIQKEYPEMISSKICELYRIKRESEIQREIFTNVPTKGKKPSKFILPYFLGSDDESKKYEKCIGEMNQLNNDERSKLEIYYSTNGEYKDFQNGLTIQLEYYKNIDKINREKNSCIQDVERFINNLEYVL